jgi:CheY-like chemotaxis protein
MSKGSEVIIVDDDCRTLELYKLIVKTVLPEAEIRGFLSVRTALEYLRHRDADEVVGGGAAGAVGGWAGGVVSGASGGAVGGASGGKGQGIIISDLHMPILDGFDFLDEFGLLPLSVRGRYAVYLLSADADAVDSARHIKVSNLAGIFTKPLTGKKFVTILRQTGYPI